MKRYGFLAGLLLLSSFAQGEQMAQWGYLSEEGPSHWGQLSPAYTSCSRGRNQSPVDLKGLIEAELPPLTLHYRKDGKEVVNNGHSIQVNYLPGSTLTVNGHEFELKQFHFHAPSENRIEGKSYPMEAHLVHADADGNLAVVAVMITEGGDNYTLSKIWEQMPEKAGDKQELKEPVNVEGLLPESRDYYMYNGSLTTPPCTEGVLWLVMKQPVTVSSSQIKKFRHLMRKRSNHTVLPCQPS